MKNSKLFAIAIFLLASSIVYADNEGEKKEEKEEKEWYQKGTVYGKIYANFHTSGTDLGKQNAFEVNRAYLGYKYTLNESFAANVKLDIGASEDLGRRFAFFKNAYLQYKVGDFKVQFGIADAFQFKVQEKFWGYRYIYKSFQDEYKFGSSADIGAFMTYKFADWISTDFSINNGDGYGLQQNTSSDNLKYTLGATVNPIKQITLRVYGDVMSFSDSSQITGVFFAGLNLGKFKVGGEYVYQTNNTLETGYDYSGISLMTSLAIKKKITVFARYDHLSSANITITDDEGAVIGEEPWNLSNDGDFIIGGIEYSPFKIVNLAVNYRYKVSADTDAGDVASLYFNIQVAF